MYSSTFFSILIIASAVSLIFVYAFQMGVFIQDHRAGKSNSVNNHENSKSDHTTANLAGANQANREELNGSR